MSVDFKPFSRYQELITEIGEFRQLSKVSYGIALQLLFRHDGDLGVPPVEDLDYAESSRNIFSMGDREATKVTLEYGWVPLDEYADREDRELTEVRQAAESGELGAVASHPESGKPLVIWPPKKQSLSDDQLPDPPQGKYKVAVETNLSQGLELDLTDEERSESIQRLFLSLANSLGDPAEVAGRAGNMLYRSCFLLHWVAFEAFLRDTVHELYRRHPKTVMSTDWAQERKASFQSIFDQSAGLTDLGRLRESLVETAIEDHEAGGQSAHGLINFLKKTFSFERDPYQAWFVIGDTKYETSYQGLMGVKQVRNSLVHQAGRPDSALFEKYDWVPSRDGVIFFDQDFYELATLMMRSICENIAMQIDAGEYRTADESD